MVFCKARRFAVILAAALIGIGAWAGAGSVAYAQPSTYEPPEVTIPSSNPFHNNKEAIKEGAAIYYKYCIPCHGPEADGSSVFGKLGADLRVFWRGYAEFIAIVTAGRAEKGMPPWGKFLDGVQVAKIGAYLETLAKPGANWK
jgi:mono/diheme cytochrome c family protein